MRARVALLATIFIATTIVACTDDPVAPALVSKRAARANTVYASSDQLSLLAVSVSGGDLEQPLRYDLVLRGGVSEQALPLPEGKGYEVSIRAFDADGTQTHEGKTYVEYVEAGENAGLGLELSPVGDKGEPVKLEVGVLGERRLGKGAQIVIETVKETDFSEPLHLKATVLDENGKAIALDPSQYHWFIDDPHVDLFDPARPTGPEDDLKWAGREDLLQAIRDRHLDVGLVVGEIQVFVGILVFVANPYVDVSAGDGVTCALRTFGTIDCWGDNFMGMLGDGLSGMRRPTQCGAGVPDDFFRCTPAPVAGGKAFSAVSVGNDHVCAIERVTNAAFCWGSNAQGQLGFSGFANQPSTPVNGMKSWRSISAGSSHSCGITTSNQAFCWGNNSFGQLSMSAGSVAVGTLVQLPNPVGYKSVSAGEAFTCAVDMNDIVECFGDRAFQPRITTAVASLGTATTASHDCVVMPTTRVVQCWGWNGQAQLGIGMTGTNTSNIAKPVTVNGVNFLADQVSAGFTHTCAVNGTDAFCWGANGAGQLGIGGFGGRFSPARVQPATGTTISFSKISAGNRHTCAMASGGGIFCWGLNDKGQVGIGATTAPPLAGEATPRRVIGS